MSGTDGVEVVRQELEVEGTTLSCLTAGDPTAPPLLLPHGTFWPGDAALGELDLGFLFAGVAAAAVLYPLPLKLFPDRGAVFVPEPDVGDVPVRWVFERHRAIADEVVV